MRVLLVTTPAKGTKCFCNRTELARCIIAKKAPSGAFLFKMCRSIYDLINASRSLLMVAASVAGMP